MMRSQGNEKKIYTEQAPRTTARGCYFFYSVTPPTAFSPSPRPQLPRKALLRRAPLCQDSSDIFRANSPRPKDRIAYCSRGQASTRAGMKPLSAHRRPASLAVRIRRRGTPFQGSPCCRSCCKRRRPLCRTALSAP